MDQELVQYLEERFERQEQRFNTRFDRLEQRLDSHAQKFDSTDQRLVSIDGRFDELKRYTGILTEELRREVQLVAEGFAVFVEGRYTQDQATIAQQFQDTRALIRSSYDHLQQQQDQSSQRVESLERKSQN